MQNKKSDNYMGLGSKREKFNIANNGKLNKSFYLFIYLSIYLSIYIIYLSFYLSIYLLRHQPSEEDRLDELMGKKKGRSEIYTAIYLSFFYIYLSIYLSIKASTI